MVVYDLIHELGDQISTWQPALDHFEFYNLGDRIFSEQQSKHLVEAIVTRLGRDDGWERVISPCAAAG